MLHSSQGNQYTSGNYQRLPKSLNLMQSTSQLDTPHNLCLVMTVIG